MDPTKKLIVPEINASELTKDDKIIANPIAQQSKWS
jgi:aspartate-semialdehyde dehydrogenase